MRYASGIDRRDWALSRTSFTGPREADHGDIGIWHSSFAITAWCAWLSSAALVAGGTLARQGL